MKKRYLYEAPVTDASGTQVFYVDALSRREADRRAANDETDGIFSNEVEVTNLGSLEFIDETTIEDFGDFPPDKAQPQEPTESRMAALEACARLYLKCLGVAEPQKTLESHLSNPEQISKWALEVTPPSLAAERKNA